MDPESFNLFYLDDGILCGDITTVAAGLRLVSERASTLGLKLKLSKCELILTAGHSSADLATLFPQELLVDELGNDRVVRGGGFEFLGAPIGTNEFCHQHANDRVTKATKLLEAIGNLPDPQVGLRLIRSCAGFCRLVYSARVVFPGAHVAALHSFDTVVRDTLDELTGLCLTDRQWRQAARSFRTGGLGLRSGERHAACAYVASRAATHAKCKEIDPMFVWDIGTDGSECARAFSALTSALPPNSVPSTDDPRLASQRFLSRLLDEAELDSQLASADAAEAANLRSETLWGASGFLTALPSKVLGLAMPPGEFIEEIKVRLWVATYPSDHFCPLCDMVSDRFGLHSRRCTHGGDLTACHHSARNQVCRFADSGGYNPTPEQSHLLPPRPDDPTANNLRRPADVFIPTWVHGSPAAFDLAITSPQRQDILAQAASETGAAAVDYESRKRQYLDTEEECQQQGILFVPLVAESSGGWGPTALATFRRLAKRAGERGGLSATTKAVLPSFLERVCIAIRSAKARAVLRRCGPCQWDTSPLDTAAAALVE